MNTGAWQIQNCADLGCSGAFQYGVDHFAWSGISGEAYSLDYAAAVPAGSPTGFGGLQIFLHLEGMVNAFAVPIPAAVWLFGSGLLGMAGLASRRKRNNY